MKGIETHFALAIIGGFVVLALLAAIIFLPGSVIGGSTGSSIDFRTFCFYWSTSDPPYKEGIGDNVNVNGQPASVAEECGKGLNTGPIQTDAELERCINSCRLRSG